jgi:hypothetical protein
MAANVTLRRGAQSDIPFAMATERLGRVVAALVRGDVPYATGTIIHAIELRPGGVRWPATRS